MPDRRLVLVDGYSLLYRAFFATRFLATSDGIPTNALFGFSQMLLSIFENIRPDAIVVALDAPGKTFRHAEFAEYKGTRKETAPELKQQFPLARDLLAALGIPQVECTGFEADDIVGTLSLLAEKNGYRTTIVTGDLDSLQLVDDYVEVLTPQVGMTTTTTYDFGKVFERLGVTPAQVADFKAIKGDTSDNIPGVPGIGDKGAAELIQTFGSIEAILERFDEVAPKYQKKIEPAKESMIQSKWLATIKRDVPIEFDFAPLTLSDQEIAAAKAILERFEMKSLAKRAETILNRYRAGGHDESADTSAAVVAEAIEVEIVEGQSLAAFTGSGPFSAVFTQAAPTALFDEAVGEAWVAVGHKVMRADYNELRDLVAREPGRAILHDSKRLYKTLDNVPTVAPRFDTMIAGYVLMPGRTQYSLPDLGQAYLDTALPTEPSHLAASLYLLEAPMRERLEKEGQTGIYDQIESPLIPVLAEMERIGIAVQRDGLKEFSASLAEAIVETQAKIFEMAGETFNIASPKQLGEVLFDKMQLPGAQKTKTGYATGAEVLQLVAHPIAQEVLSWRELSKLKSTYADGLERLIGPDGRIHTTYNQTVAATGRLSSNDPNLQNIPIRTELGRGIRKAFVASPGTRLVSFDYSQIELRILAHMCEEASLVKAFRERVDVHTTTASLMFNVPESEVTKDQRRYAKMLNYAVLYGVTDFGLANQLGGGFSRVEARQLIELYNERFPGVKEFTKSVVAEAKAKGFTTTLRGRRRYFPDIHAARVQDRQYAERQAMNAPIQGTAADMLKIAMLDVRRLIEGTGVWMLLTVHDELVFEFPTDDRKDAEPIRQAMEQALPLNVPVEVDAKEGPNWNDMTLIPAP
ncbi:MAG: DNA polymerase I [Armatimonadetes bacterium]|nr:DNA polymerase I [Armatimonadota bacterium]